MSGVSVRKPPCTGCTLTATAPRSNWRAASAAGGWCRCGLTLATRRNRAGWCAMIGSRSSAGWIPVARGLYSANSSAASTPSASRYASSRAGTGSPSGPNTSRQPESWPYSTAHWNHAGLTVLRRGTCMWASITVRPSIIAGAWSVVFSRVVEAPEFGLVAAGGLDVRLDRGRGQVGGQAGLLDRGGDAGDQGARRDLEALQYERRGGHDRARADPGPVQRDRARADDAPIRHDAAFQVRVVPDHAVGADERGPVAGGVHHGSVLHGRPRADLDRAVVAAQHRARPHRRLRADPDPADDHGVGVDEGRFGDVRFVRAQGVDRQGNPFVSSGSGRS